MSTNVEQIKDRLNIVEVISSYIKVEKTGINFKARCPFHNEKTPSFFISPSRQNFYCFGCGEKGDIFSFVQKFEGVDFVGALKILADRAGIELENVKEEDTVSKEEKNELFEIMEAATKFYEKNLEANQSGLEYLNNRSLKKEDISKWRLGFAKDEWRDLHDFLLSKNFSKEKMLEAGLLKTPVLNSGEHTEQKKYYDTFRNRIMFPIFDTTGRVIAFSGRAMREDEKTPKYLNSPETKLFHKSEVLYGFNIAKNSIRKLDYAILVEGQMDLLMSHQAGVTNTVASSGTALTEGHLQKIQKLTNRVIVAYDSDSAGEKASLRAAEIALALGMEVKIASLPKGEDPASLIKTDPEQWKNALKNSEHFLDFALNKTLRESAPKNLTREIIKNVLPLVNLIKSDIEKNQFVRKIANKIGVNEEAVWNDIRKIKTNDVNQTYEIQTKNSPDSLEKIMAGIIFLEATKDNFEWEKKWKKISGETVVAEILEQWETEKDRLIFETEKNFPSSNSQNGYEDILKRIEIKVLKNKIKELSNLLDKKTEKNDEYEKEITEAQKRLKEIGT